MSTVQASAPSALIARLEVEDQGPRVLGRVRRAGPSATIPSSLMRMGPIFGGPGSDLERPDVRLGANDKPRVGPALEDDGEDEARCACVPGELRDAEALKDGLADERHGRPAAQPTRATLVGSLCPGSVNHTWSSTMVRLPTPSRPSMSVAWLPI